MWNQYILEFMGVVTIIYAKLLTEADPTVMAIVYFAMFNLAKGVTTGFFTPIGSLAAWMVGRVPTQEFMYNVIAQISAAVAVAITFIPVKAYIDRI
jgi:hypothetical protein